jgi:hypothetical protein
MESPGFSASGSAAGAGASLAGSPVGVQSASDRDDDGPDDFNEATIAQLQAAMSKGRMSAVELTRFICAASRRSTRTAPQLGDRAQS